VFITVAIYSMLEKKKTDADKKMRQIMLFITFLYFSVYLVSYLCVELIEKYRAEIALDVLSENLVFSSLKFSKQTVQI